jgi:hypothetical protein
MTIPINALDETKPAGSRAASLGDNDIREYKTQNREILEVNHVYPSSGQSADAGKHKMVHLIEQADLGTGAEGKPILGAQTVSGKAELLFTDEDNNDVQITSGGRIRGASIRLANDVSLTGRNQANSADVDIIKVNTSNQAQVTPALIPSGGVILPEISAPTTIAGQGALYTKNDGSQTELYFREQSNGDEVKITSGGGLNISALRSKLVAVNVTSTGTLAVTGVGFSPKSIQFVTAYITSGANAAGSGLCDLSRNCASSSFTRKSDGATYSDFSTSTIRCGSSLSGFTVGLEFTVSSLDSDGFTISRTTANANSTCYALCIG